MILDWLEEFFSSSSSPSSSSSTPSMWSSEQQARLNKERKILSQYFPDFSWENPKTPGKTYLIGWMKTNSGARYKLRLDVPVDVPNSAPSLYLVYPKPLYDFRGKSLADYGPSPDMHILSPDDGNVKICHYRPSKWTPAVTFYKVLMKGRIWLEAYEGHKATGKPLDFYLPHQVD